MALAPVAVFAYNRLDKIKLCIKALEKNDIAHDTELFIFSDGAKGEWDEGAVKEVQNWLCQYVKESTAFSKIHLELKDHNCGLANSIIIGVSAVISRFGKVIVVEDDIIASPFFLRYMNDGLAFYKDISNIWSITSFGGYKLKSLKRYNHDVYVGYRASSWGWATWLDRWNTVDWMVTDYDELRNSKQKQKCFNRGGRDLYKLLRRQMEGKIDSWAIRWTYSASKQNMLTIYPKIGFANNIGLDGSGVHCAKNSKYMFNEECANEYNIKFENVRIEKRIAKELYWYNTDSVIKKLYRKICRVIYAYQFNL